MKTKSATFFFCVLMSIASSAIAQLPFSDGFESGGFISGGWAASGNAVVSTQAPSQGNYCAEGPSSYGLLKHFSALTDSFITVVFDIKASQTNTTCLVFRIKDTIGNTSAGIIVNDQGLMVGVNGGGGSLVTLLNYTPQTWYTVQMAMDMTTKTYDIYIDNQLVADDFNFYSPGFTMPFDFSWSSVAASGTAWLDGITIYAGLTGIPQNNRKENILKIYPNPATDRMTISLHEDQNCKWKIFKLTGEEIKNGVLKSHDKTISVEGLDAGLYTIQVTGQLTGKIYNKAFVVD